MSDLVVDRYKDALKAGHVAVLRGRPEDALAHYQAAVDAAPDRPLPYSSLGGVLAGLGRFEEARAAYARALGLGSREEGTLIGLAEALLALERGSDAAAALDRLAELQAATARLPEGLQTLERADALAPDRRRSKRMAEFRAAIEGAPLRVATHARAPRPAAPRPDKAPRRPRALGPKALAAIVAGNLRGRSGRSPGRATAPGAATARPENVDGRAEGEALCLQAEAAAGEGRTDDALKTFADAAAAYLAAGHEVAAIDACQRGLGLGPMEPALHLQLARVYLELGWTQRAVSKLVLLDRLLQMDGDRLWRAELAGLAAERLPDEPALAGIIGADASRRPARA